MTYVLGLENAWDTYEEFDPLYRQHFAEMKARLEKDGIPIGDYNPRVEQYANAANSGWFLHYTARKDGKPVGYLNVYLTQDMHTSELIAQEDTVYCLPEHRNGLGRKLVKLALEDLRSRGVKRVHIQPVTDLRVAKIWARMGFREAASVMIYNME